MSDLENDDDIPATLDTSAPEVSGEHRGNAQGRVLSESTRALFAKAATKVKAAIESGDVDDLVPAIDAEPAEPAPAPAEPEAPAPAAEPAPAESPAAAALDAERAAFEAERAAFAAERDAWAKERASADADEAPENPAAAVRELVRRWTGAADDAALRAEMADLVTELSSEVLGVPLAPATKAELMQKRTERMVRAHQAKLDKRERELAEKERARIDAAERAEAHRMLTSALAAKADALPFLAAEDDGAQIVMSVIEADFKRTGKLPAWEDAAARAEAAIKQRATAWQSKRSKLFSTATPVAPQGNAPKSSATSTGAALTNRGAAGAAPPPPSSVADESLSMEERRARSLQRLAARAAERGATT